MEKHETDGSTRTLINRVRSQLPRAMLRDRSFVRRRLARLRKTGKSGSGDDLLAELAALEIRLAASIREREDRARRVPRFTFPRELPISNRAEEIVRTIRDHPVTIISGETGSGKSTQLPKMCLRAGRGVTGQIACTQPRRIAAITIAHRIASELKENLGSSVGYKIRFRDRSSSEGFIKVLTDGMLLAETQTDPFLEAYDTLIIDEAHERSLNIDFLLGIARTLLERRPELKLVITSATLDTEKFSRAFGNAPVIEVSGRQYPVEVEYRPAGSFPGKTDDLDYVDLAAKAVQLIKEKKKPGDILVFMPTEQDILETCERIEGRRYPGTTVLPLYARLPGTQQGKVYHVKGAKIVVATNVAETSLTIPGIRYVVDTGLARISQYQPGTRINSLPVSPIARSSADQRAGRCGRVAEGLCIRLYSEKEYASRLPFTPPEILRSNLAEVILRMIDLRLGHPVDFPFVDRPKPNNIKDGYDTLIELGAIRRSKGREYALTGKGRLMARMPLDPKISRMLLEARNEGCLREVSVVAAVLSIRDPRERPPDKTELADAMHSSFRHSDSDFLTFLNIWDRYHDTLEKLGSRRKQRRFCSEHFLSFPRMREWVHVHDQILAILQEQKIALGRRGRVEVDGDLYAGIHRSILSGYLSNIAVHKEKNFYSAAKSREVMVFPGSTLFGKSRPWIVAAEMVRTSRLFARSAARIDPGWLEALGGDLCRSIYSEPRWDKDRGEVRALERVTLYGLEIVSGRQVSYARINPGEAHEIFIRSALVGGELESPPGFLRHNLELLERLSRSEEKLRKRGILAGEDVLAEFYSSRLAGICEERSLRKLLKDRKDDRFLRMSEEDVMQSLPDEEALAGYPDSFQVGELRLPAEYRFAPGKADDGVTLRVPGSEIARIPEEALEWGMPGQYREKITALVKGLPKRYRKHLVPVAEKTEIILAELKPGEASLHRSLSDFVRRRFRVDIPAEAWAEAEIPAHLRFRVSVIGPDERELGSGRDLAALKRKQWDVPEPASERWAEARKRWEKKGLASWDIDALPEKVSVGPFVAAYPALTPSGQGVDLKLFASEDRARVTHRTGVRALLELRLGRDLEFLRPYLALPEELQGAALYFGGVKALEEAMLEALLRETLQKDLRSREAFLEYAEGLNSELNEKGHLLARTVNEILPAYQRVRRVLGGDAGAPGTGSAVQELCEELKRDLADLVPRDFLSVFSLDRLHHIPRYLEALALRGERARIEPAKDKAKAARAQPFLQALRSLRDEPDGAVPSKKSAAVDEFRWMIEEYKVSLFAPELKTAFPISPKRLSVKLSEIRDMS